MCVCVCVCVCVLEKVWRGEAFGSVQERLSEDYDSVEGGPHRPMLSGRGGADDSLIYVVYHPSQCLPKFIVTYTKKGEGC